MTGGGKLRNGGICPTVPMFTNALLYGSGLFRSVDLVILLCSTFVIRNHSLSTTFLVIFQPPVKLLVDESMDKYQSVITAVYSQSTVKRRVHSMCY